MSSSHRHQEIDGLRGIAALSVMLGHWGEFLRKQNAPAEWYDWLGKVFLEYFSFGRLGIVAFFCVSGFVVPFSFRGPQPLVTFPITRFFRLYPAYWTSIFVAAAVFPLCGQEPFTAIRILVNMTMLQIVLGQSHIIGPYWTLFVELIFYGVCYAMFAARLLHRPFANFVVMCILLGIALAGGFYRYVHPENNFAVGVPTYLAAMHFGTIARLHTLEHQGMPRWLYPASLAILLGAVMTANTAAYYYAQNELVGWVAADVGYLIGVGLFLLAIHRHWFSGPRLAWLGLISYSMYLFHMIVKQVCQAIWPAAVPWELAAGTLTLLYFMVTILVATVVHSLVETPMIRIGRSTERFAERTLRLA
ncbi:acyltransferase family protein [Sphingomonas sp. ID0503]|uniref:acyltransferase family protein n=1 Tax=Sphingomonas sp. ID0503 TaxID=3399691 RepID=UPI003AFAC821